jgi:hypothetical protein
MQMNEGLDTGDILLTEKVKLDPKETGGSLFDRLSDVGAQLLVKTLEEAKAGTLKPQKQNEEEIDRVAIESMLMELCASYGQLHITVSDATSDGVISQKEENQINARRDQHIATLHKYLDGQISLHRRERKK